MKRSVTKASPKARLSLSAPTKPAGARGSNGLEVNGGKSHAGQRGAVLDGESKTARGSFREIFEFVPVGILVLDREGLIEDCNPAATHLLGLPHVQVVGRTFDSFAAVESRAGLREHWRRVFASGRPEKCDVMLQPPGGSVRHAAVHSVYRAASRERRAHCLMALSHITTTRHADEKLKESQARLAEVVSSAMDGLITTDDQLRVLLFNAAAERMFQRTAQEMVGQSLDRLVPERFRISCHQQLQGLVPTESVQRNQPFITTSLGLRTDGAEFPIEMSLSSIATGGQRLFTMILRDLTERRRAEKSLELFRALIDRSHDGVEVIDPLTGRFLDGNAQAFEALGFTREEFLNLTVFDVAPNISRDLYDRNMVVLRDVGTLTFEDVHQRKDGVTFPIEVTLSLLTIEREFLVATVRDISQRKEMEAALRVSGQHLENFFAESPLGLLWVGAEGRVERANQAFCDLVGCASDEVMGRPIAAWFVKPSLAVHFLERLAQRETVHDTRARLKRKDGTALHVVVDANGLWRDGAVVYSRWFVRDVSRRIELQREVLAIAERERRRLGHDLHDDLCQHLSGIEFLSETLAGVLDRASKEGARRAREIGRLTSEAIDHARGLAQGLAPISLQSDGLVTALRGLALRTRQIFRRDCRLVCEKPVTVADVTISSNLYHIAQEAVNNAIRHGKARTLRINLRKEKGCITLVIQDDGVGMPDKPLKKRGMGLQVMRYRASMIDAALVVSPGVAGGTEVKCTLGHGD